MTSTTAGYRAHGRVTDPQVKDAFQQLGIVELHQATRVERKQGSLTFDRIYARAA